jgi:hypothetical protein
MLYRFLIMGEKSLVPPVPLNSTWPKPRIRRAKDWRSPVDSIATRSPGYPRLDLVPRVFTYQASDRMLIKEWFQGARVRFGDRGGGTAIGLDGAKVFSPEAASVRDENSVQMS